jgi:hypothetical protein
MISSEGSMVVAPNALGDERGPIKYPVGLPRRVSFHRARHCRVKETLCR